MAGLAAAKVLSDAGLNVLVLEKSLECGGRMSTVRMGDGSVDVGAQFFTARSPEFTAQIKKWEIDGALSLWFEKDFMGTAERCLYAPGGMTKLAWRMAEGLGIKTDATVLGFRTEKDVWNIQLGRGETCI